MSLNTFPNPHFLSYMPPAGCYIHVFCCILPRQGARQTPPSGTPVHYEQTVRPHRGSQVHRYTMGKVSGPTSTRRAASRRSVV
jgi:hypothetical protein